MRPGAGQLAGLAHWTLTHVPASMGHSVTLYAAQAPPAGGVTLMVAEVGLVGWASMMGDLHRVRSESVVRCTCRGGERTVAAHCRGARHWAATMSPLTQLKASSSRACWKLATSGHQAACPSRSPCTAAVKSNQRQHTLSAPIYAVTAHSFSAPAWGSRAVHIISG